MIQTLFTILVVFQFLFMALHDWLDIPGWTHGRQVRAALGTNKMLIGTLINCLFPGLAVGFAFFYWHKPKPAFVVDYWLIYCLITGTGAIMSWWIPYFFGASEKKKQFYAALYAGTYQVLPPRGDNPRPNVLHLLFHALFLCTLVLAVMIWLRVR